MTAPLVVRFVPGSALHVERDRVSELPIHRNGPPGTFVKLAGGLRVSLPTDQIVSIHDSDAVIVGFGGMRFTGVEQTRLTFLRVRDLRPESQLSPDRSWRMTLEIAWVAWVQQDGVQAWPVAQLHARR